jgi:hypothetical protein
LLPTSLIKSEISKSDAAIEAPCDVYPLLIKSQMQRKSFSNRFRNNADSFSGAVLCSLRSKRGA